MLIQITPVCSLLQLLGAVQCQCMVQFNDGGAVYCAVRRHWCRALQLQLVAIWLQILPFPPTPPLVSSPISQQICIGSTVELQCI